MRIIVLFSLFALSVADDAGLNTRRFPPNFKFGAANAAPQIEGAWNLEGKGETIWDHFAHTYPERIVDRSTPDVACDSYHKYKEDVALVKKMGLDIYRLSIAWSRILPTGYTDQVNSLGVKYYKNLFKELKANHIEPLVTLYHWDLPQPLQDSLGGWLNETVADLFADYARLCFELFNDDVTSWITINEPKQVCLAGYGSGAFAPGIQSDGVGDYVCVKNVLLAHAKAYRIYDKEFRSRNKGKVSIVLDSTFWEPGSDSEADQEAAQRILQFDLGIYGHPIFIGDWPEVVKSRVAMRSRLEGYSQSRLPVLSAKEIELIKGTHDYIAINHYSTQMVNATVEAPIGRPSGGADRSVLVWNRPEWQKGSSDWFNVVPWGLRKLLNWLKNQYGDEEIIITENGYADTDATLEDDRRVGYYQGYLSSCLDAIYKDNVNLTAYVTWSIIDDWEWTGGYSSFLGMYRVDFNDPDRPRIKRKSADYFTNVVKNRCVVDKDQCTDS
ncbi:unnamed protein product [Phaedon cochleariae]|uniref:Glycosyl hydrolase n=1 Tax=Phaedon cochleariae TaxID=80249 RepID=A0A9P0DWG1_PHACE|nr:unnamed protein product [Phaedon cochleariae]